MARSKTAPAADARPATEAAPADAPSRFVLAERPSPAFLFSIW